MLYNMDKLAMNMNQSQKGKYCMILLCVVKVIDTVDRIGGYQGLKEGAKGG
jgi:hypothetical protein